MPVSTPETTIPYKESPRMQNTKHKAEITNTTTPAHRACPIKSKTVITEAQIAGIGYPANKEISLFSQPKRERLWRVIASHSVLRLIFTPLTLQKA
jgi:hypothetical protein